MRGVEGAVRVRLWRRGAVLAGVAVLSAVVLASAQGATSRVGAARAQAKVSLPNPPAGMVTLRVAFDYYRGLPGKLQVYEPVGKAKALFAMSSLPAGEKPPAGRLIKNGIFFVKPGVLKLLELVYKNPTGKTGAFMAIAPTFDPAAAHPYAYARCFCAAIRYTAPPHGTWYRTIAVGVGVPVKPGTKVTITWPVIGLK